MQGAGIIFFAYLGFDMVSCLAEEVENPQQTLPRGIVGSLLISMSIYVGVAIVVTGYVCNHSITERHKSIYIYCSMAPVDVLGREIPLINAFSYAHLGWFNRVISAGSMFGLTTAAFTCMMGQPRIFYMMARDVG